MWSAIPVALLCILVIVGDGLQGSGPEGTDDLCSFSKYDCNQLPKGNMWSAIPVALLCMLVTEGDGKQGRDLSLEAGI